MTSSVIVSVKHVIIPTLSFICAHYFQSVFFLFFEQLCKNAFVSKNIWNTIGPEFILKYFKPKTTINATLAFERRACHCCYNAIADEKF